MENKKIANNQGAPKNKKAKEKINEYMEKRREDRYRADEAFARAVMPDSKTREDGTERTVIYRNGVDTRFLVYVIVLLCFGAVMSYSASYVYAEQKYDDSSYFIVRYIIFALAAVAITVPFVMYARPWFWKCFGTVAYIGSILLLMLVPVLGKDGGGAQRWLDLGFITVQPSEIAKMAVVMMLAFYMSKYDKQITCAKDTKTDFKYGVLYPALIFGFVCLLVALEKHISGLMIIGMIGISVMFMGGTRMKWIFLIIGTVAVAGCLLILVSSYAQERVNTWLNIDKVDPLGSAWQTLQGLYAIGSGGIFGVGLGNSRQKYGYVSQPQNDFVFTIICEELGFFGAAFVIIMFALLVIRGFKIAAHAPDKYTSLLVFGLTFKVALQTILNIAVVTNSMPNTGISLPFFSSGGTSLALQIFEMGIILSVSRFSTVKKR
ncbi:MAG: FtsW/RodA/SpoVE family cell cycle protein [Eubacteriales bacterium]